MLYIWEKFCKIDIVKNRNKTIQSFKIYITYKLILRYSCERIKCLSKTSTPQITIAYVCLTSLKKSRLSKSICLWRVKTSIIISFPAYQWQTLIFPIAFTVYLYGHLSHYGNSHLQIHAIPAYKKPSYNTPSEINFKP